MRGCYIARPIDAAGNNTELDSLVSAVAREAAISFGWSFNPQSAFRVGPNSDPGPEIQEINMEAMRQAAVVVAFMPSGVPSIGVPMEVSHAIHHQKWVIVITDQSKSWVMAWMEDSLDNVEVIRYETIGNHDDILDAVLEVWDRRTA